MKQWMFIVSLFGIIVQLTAGEIPFREIGADEEPCCVVIVAQSPPEGFQESMYTLPLQENWGEGFAELAQTVLNKVWEDRVPYVVFTYVEGQKQTKELLPLLQESWKKVEKELPLFSSLRGAWNEEISYAGWGSKDSAAEDARLYSPKARPFLELPLTVEDKKNIRFIVTSMAEKNVLQLLMEKSELERRGNLIRNVHPLRFLCFVLSDGYLRKSLKSVEKDYLKWPYFIDDYKDKMKEMHNTGQLHPHVPGFSEYTGISEDHIENLLQQKDYDNFVRSLLSLY